jgi:hypothetical protein
VGVSTINYYDDLAINDTSGGADDSWCGDGRIIALTPNANGDLSQLTGSDGNSTDNYLLVDDVPSNGDTDYVEGSTVDQKDLYNLTACGLTGVIIKRVWAASRSRDTVAAGGLISLVVKTNSTEYAGTDRALATSYAEVLGDIHTVNPNTSGAWSTSDLDALQVGPKLGVKMAKRTSQVIANAEYVPDHKARTSQVIANAEYVPDHKARTSQMLAMVEYVVAAHIARTSQVLVMVEYTQDTLPGRRYGPAAQSM